MRKRFVCVLFAAFVVWSFTSCAVVGEAAIEGEFQTWVISSERRQGNRLTNAEFSHSFSANVLTSCPDRKQCSIVKRAGLTCGQVNPQLSTTNKVLFGQEAYPGSFPYQARIIYSDGLKKHLCGGIIIDTQHILTAAHCVSERNRSSVELKVFPANNFTVILGDHSQSNSCDCQVQARFAKSFVHSGFDLEQKFGDDIALVRLIDRIDYSFTRNGFGSINRVCLPDSTDESYAGSAITVGWGRTENGESPSDKLLFANIPIVNWTQCRRSSNDPNLTDKQVCAGEKLQGGFRGSFKGDSGGPLVQVVNGKHQLIGITSYGSEKNTTSINLSVYTKVSSYLCWIRENLAKSWNELENSA